MLAYMLIIAAKRKEKEGMLAKAREWLASLPEAAAVIPGFIRKTPLFQEKLASLRQQGRDFLATVQANDEFHIPPFKLPEPASVLQALAKKIFEEKIGFAVEPTPEQAEEFKQLFARKVEEGVEELGPKEPPPKDTRKPGVHFMTPVYQVEKPQAPTNNAQQPIVESTIEGDTRDPMLRLGFAILNGNKKQAAHLKGIGWYTDHLGNLYTRTDLGAEAQPTQEDIEEEMRKLQREAFNEQFMKDELSRQMTSLSKDVAKIIKNDAMFKAANGVAMAVAGIIVGLMAVPVVGWIVAAVLAVVSAMMTMIDKKYQAQVQALANGVQNRLRMYQIGVDTKIKNETLNVYEQTFNKAFSDVKDELQAEYQRLGLDKPFKKEEIAATQATAAAIEGLGEEAQQEAQKQGVNPAVALFLYFGLNPGAQAAFTQGWQQMVTAFNYNWEQFAKANAAAQRQMTMQITKGFENTAKAWNRAWQEMTGQKVEDESTWDKAKGSLKNVWQKFRPYAPLAAGMPPEAWSHYSGQMMVKSVSAKLAQLEAVGKQQIDLTYLAQKKQLDNPKYREHLYLQIKQAIIQSPQVKAILKNMHKVAKGREEYYQRAAEIKKQLKAKEAAERATTVPPPTTQTTEAQTAPVSQPSMAPSPQPPKKKSKAPLVIGAGAAAFAAYLFLR